MTDKMFEILENDPMSQKMLESLNKHAADYGISPDSDEYQELRKTTLMMIIAQNKEAVEKLGDQVYDEIMEDVKNEN